MTRPRSWSGGLIRHYPGLAKVTVPTPNWSTSKNYTEVKWGCRAVRILLLLQPGKRRALWFPGGVRVFKFLVRISVPAVLATMTVAAHAAQLSGDARSAIPHNVQQLVVIDYRAMQNSNTAMELRDRVMPPDLKQFDEAIRKSGLNDNHDVDQLAFALFRTGASSDSLETVGIAQGQFDVQGIMANFQSKRSRPSWCAPTTSIRWRTPA